MDEYESERLDAMGAEYGTQGGYMAEAFRQYAAVYGEADRGRQWILTPYDTWEKNPYYSGPPQRHPEDDYDE